MLKQADFASKWRKLGFRGLKISKFSRGGGDTGPPYSAPFVWTPYAENLDPRQRGPTRNPETRSLGTFETKMA